ncbi:MAG: aromatic/alkene monooxygenase hydroxylase subunit beta [Porticoccaceae bacterium]
MSEAPEILKPLKTWSYLANKRRKPSEYEVVSTNLHTQMEEGRWRHEIGADVPMSQWYKRYRAEGLLRHADWDAFRDPDQLVYRSYNLLQDGQETYVRGLFDQFNERGHDQMLEADWVRTLERFYTPTRYLFHGVQMASAYLHQIAPASTITNCACFQAGDSLRWVSHTSYRTQELANGWNTQGFSLGGSERNTWESDPAWQGMRKLIENMLVSYDWGESFFSINLIAKPVINSVVLGGLAKLARENNDMLLDLLCQAQLRDAERHLRWTRALVEMALLEPANRDVLTSWKNKWMPLAEEAASSFGDALGPGLSESCLQDLGTLHASLGI